MSPKRHDAPGSEHDEQLPSSAQAPNHKSLEGGVGGRTFLQKGFPPNSLAEPCPPTASWRLGAPSFVLPGSVAENCRFLAGRVDEVSLLLLESAACLAYGEADLPPWLAELPGRSGPLHYHAHLPLDLPWHRGATTVAELCLALAAKIALCRPRSFVLHPPLGACCPSLLEEFLSAWRAEAPPDAELLLENIHGNDLALCLPLTYAGGYGLCLDFGHALAYGQEWLLTDQRVLERVRLVHLSAPWGDAAAKPGHGHHSLRRLTAQQAAMLDALLTGLGPGRGRCLLPELFQWTAWEDSATWLQERGHGDLWA